jgi:hypothetical protein
MRSAIFYLGVLTTACSYAQVGIGTTNPNVSFHVEGEPTNAAKTDGIIIPRLTGDQLRSKNALYTSNQTGAMVYITAPDSAPAGKTSNVTSTGFYFYDNGLGQWVPIKEARREPWRVENSTTLATDNSENIYQTGAVAVGTSTRDNSAKFDVSATDKGFLPPRVNLTSITMDLDGQTGQARGLLVFNSGTTLNQGYYYWDGTVWRRLSDSGVRQNVTIVTGNRTSANAYVVQDDDYYIFIRLTGTTNGINNVSNSFPFLNSNHNIVLPNPALHRGRELYLINDSLAVNTGFDAYTNYPIYGTYSNTTSFNYSTNSQGEYLLNRNFPKVKIVSDGTRWICVAISIV